MKIKAILETETLDPDFREPFLDGMPIDITEASLIELYDMLQDVQMFNNQI